MSGKHGCLPVKGLLDLQLHSMPNLSCYSILQRRTLLRVRTKPCQLDASDFKNLLISTG
ncbi:hypothetical protein EMIT0P74_30330 [Pseudomonas sp. IT-P74]